MTNSTNSYRGAATRNFEALAEQYNSGTYPECQGAAFWKLGNTFDTMIDYLDVVDPGNAKSVESIVKTQFTTSLKCLGGLANAWFDDFGWWTVATQRALQRNYFNTATFKTIHDECWRQFTENAPFVWQRRTTRQFDAYGPLVNGGVWNAYWIGTSPNFPGPKNGDPANKELIGIQNTVTNALYLMSAQRDPDSRPAAESEFQFLLTWLTRDLHVPSLWWSLGPNAGLVRERVSAFADGKPASGEEPHGFETNWAWTGDQGLMLGNLSDAIRLQPSHSGLLLSLAKSVIAGARQMLFRDGEVKSYTKTGWVPDGDEGDYQTGPGVFWRNVLYAWATNSNLRTFLAQLDYQNMLRASADAVVNEPTTNQSLETLTNRTAVLVAATALLT